MMSCLTLLLNFVVKQNRAMGIFMEKKKSVISKVFGCVNKVENVILAIMVVGMLVTILADYRTCNRTSLPMDRRNQPLPVFMDDVCGFGIRI